MDKKDVKLAIDRCIAHDLPDVADLIKRLAAELDGFRRGSEAESLRGIKMRREIDELRAELAALQEQEPVAWMLECQTMTGDTCWRLSWSRSGAGVCRRLNGDAHEKPLYLAPVAQPAVSVPDGWESELLDWVSACQSAYHIDNTPGHRFGGLGSNLDENRQSFGRVRASPDRSTGGQVVTRDIRARGNTE